MGCGGSVSAKAAREVPEVRRRLSVSSVETEDTKGGGKEGDKPEEDVEVAEEERSMIMQLSTQQVLDFVTDDGGRKYSIGSETDKALHRKNSFSSKDTVKCGQVSSNFTQEGIGYACKKGLKPEAPNQDSFFIMKVEGQYSIYGVFDGHGKKGHDVSNFVKDTLPKLLLSASDKLCEDPMSCLQKAFEKTQKLIEKATGMNKIDANRSGSTASVILHDTKKHTLYVAHVGDSRCVLGKQDPRLGSDSEWQAVDLTVDHKPNDPGEKARIEKMGGQVLFDGGCNYRVYAKGKRYPGLNMSRAMGDLLGFYDAGISCQPDIHQQTLANPKEPLLSGVMPAEEVNSKIEEAANGENTATEKGEAFIPSGSPSLSSHDIDPVTDQFVLLCSDGVWEFVSSQEAVKTVGNFQPDQAMKAAEHLATMSWNRWMNQMKGVVVDDITAVLIYLGTQRIETVSKSKK
eukprot:gnl/TRDRNA2_/TRDRNA2_165463_c0_seq1.p1 gnl/TRDRNA2_/TRDRNA2_165463_c0~~gnl/TRDRNA2_/TRDRNA2_165463_c0_seq1.p1  ORF type:complete len:458 (+),score=111.75 gnl/TRDRNA2_/TRDRNA2_165463_c0_seq1:114-1487(+)